MFTTLGIGWASTTLAVISIIMLPIPWLLFLYGPVLRKRSRFETVVFDADGI